MSIYFAIIHTLYAPVHGFLNECIFTTTLGIPRSHPLSWLQLVTYFLWSIAKSIISGRSLSNPWITFSALFSSSSTILSSSSFDLSTVYSRRRISSFVIERHSRWLWNSALTLTIHTDDDKPQWSVDARRAITNWYTWNYYLNPRWSWEPMKQTATYWPWQLRWLWDQRWPTHGDEKGGTWWFIICSCLSCRRFKTSFMNIRVMPAQRMGIKSMAHRDRGGRR